MWVKLKPLLRCDAFLKDAARCDPGRDRTAPRSPPLLCVLVLAVPSYTRSVGLSAWVLLLTVLFEIPL